MTKGYPRPRGRSHDSEKAFRYHDVVSPSAAEPTSDEVWSLKGNQ